MKTKNPVPSGMPQQLAIPSLYPAPGKETNLDDLLEGQKRGMGLLDYQAESISQGRSSHRPSNGKIVGKAPGTCLPYPI